MNHTPKPIGTLRRIVLAGKLPEDIAEAVKEALRLFHAVPALFDTPNLAGPAKRAELIVKLAYWLVLGKLTAGQFRDWAARIPPDDNQGWDVDLEPESPGSHLPPVLKMGRFYPPVPAGAAAKD